MIITIDKMVHAYNRLSSMAYLDFFSTKRLVIGFSILAILLILIALIVFLFAGKDWRNKRYGEAKCSFLAGVILLLSGAFLTGATTVSNLCNKTASLTRIEVLHNADEIKGKNNIYFVKASYIDPIWLINPNKDKTKGNIIYTKENNFNPSKLIYKKNVKYSSVINKNEQKECGIDFSKVKKVNNKQFKEELSKIFWNHKTEW